MIRAFCKASIKRFFSSSLKMAAAIANGHSELHFEPVEKKSELFPVIKEELQKRTLVYGEQETTLKKLEEGSDRSCELLLKDAKPVTLLIYKTNPISKTENVEVINSFEVKTFLPIDKSSISKYLSKTLDRAIEIAKEKRAENIHLTCSEREKPTFNFLINNNFKVCETWDGKYVDGVKEFLMYKSLKDIKDEESKCAEKKLDEKNKMEPVKSEDDNNKKRRYKEDEHHDDNKRPRYEKSHEKSSSSRDRDWRGHQRNNGQRQGGYQRPEGVDDSCTLMKKYVHYIKDGRKTVEGRLNVPMFQKWREGMTIRFHYRNPTDDVYVKILRVKKYRSFREMLEAEGVRNCIPDLRTINEGVEAYLKIPRYKERERLGVLAFRIQMVDKPQ